jgi:hypothetical protein
MAKVYKTNNPYINPKCKIAINMTDKEVETAASAFNFVAVYGFQHNNNYLRSNGTNNFPRTVSEQLWMQKEAEATEHNLCLPVSMIQNLEYDLFEVYLPSVPDAHTLLDTMRAYGELNRIQAQELGIPLEEQQTAMRFVEQYTPLLQSYVQQNEIKIKENNMDVREDR